MNARTATVKAGEFDASAQKYNLYRGYGWTHEQSLREVTRTRMLDMKDYRQNISLIRARLEQRKQPRTIDVQRDAFLLRAHRRMLARAQRELARLRREPPRSLSTMSEPRSCSRTPRARRRAASRPTASGDGGDDPPEPPLQARASTGGAP